MSNFSKYHDDKQSGMTTIIKVDGEILHSDALINCYRNGTAFGFIKKRSIARQYICSMQFSSAMNGKGIWDPLGGGFRKTFITECLPQLKHNARDGVKVIDWFTANKASPIRRRLNSFERRYYYYTDETEVEKLKETYPPYESIKHKGKGITMGNYNLVFTPEDDGKLLIRRFGCGECLFCQSRRWPECNRQYFTGVFKEATLKRKKNDPNSTVQPRKKTKLCVPESELPYTILPDKKIKCKICKNARVILKKSWNTHKNSATHKHLVSQQIQ